MPAFPPKGDPRRTRAFAIGGALLAGIVLYQGADFWDDDHDHVEISIGDDDRDRIRDSVRENVRGALRGDRERSAESEGGADEAGESEDGEGVRDRVARVRENLAESREEIRQIAEEAERTGNDEAAEQAIEQIVEEAVAENIDALTE